MTGIEFLRLALKLSAGTEEADLRSAVSRAYYGAFHLAYDLVDECGIQLPASAEAHRKLRYCLDASDDPNARMASKHLDTLRSERNAADYDLRDSEPFTRASVAVQIKAALDVEALVRRCKEGGSQSSLCAKMRAYARDVLRLVTR